MQLPRVDQVSDVLFVFIAAFIIITGRYFLIAGIFNFFLGKKDVSHRVMEKQYPPNQFQKEVMWSLITGSIFAAAAVFTLWLWQEGYTKVYLNVYEKSLWWLPASLLISMFIHETYYYWLHRWMHKPSVFRIVHAVHHHSHITSPWTAFSFHPIEGLMQAVVLPVTLVLVPMHPYVLLVQLTIMTFSSVINHLNLELYPAKFNKHIMGRWLIGATHHALHHKQFKYNFGLYFTFWDKWKRTESPIYDELFDAQKKK